MYGLPPFFSHSLLNSVSKISAPRFRVKPVSSKLNSHICMSSVPVNTQKKMVNEFLWRKNMYNMRDYLLFNSYQLLVILVVSLDAIPFAWRRIGHRNERTTIHVYCCYFLDHLVKWLLNAQMECGNIFDCCLEYPSSAVLSAL